LRFASGFFAEKIAEKKQRKTPEIPKNLQKAGDLSQHTPNFC